MAAVLIVLYLCLLCISVSLAEQKGIPSHAAKFTSRVLTGTLKGTTKAGYYFVQPKHVEIGQVYGLWRLDLDDGGILNLEVTPKHVVLVDPKKQEKLVLPYEFKPAKWPVRARIEFKTKNVAYQVVIHRKVMASDVLKLKGTIRQLGRWGSQRAIAHTFRGKRRLKVEVQSEDEEDDGNDDNGEIDESEDKNEASVDLDESESEQEDDESNQERGEL